MLLALCMIWMSVSGTAISAQEPVPELNFSGNLQTQLQARATRWPVVQEPVLLAFVAAEDRQFFARPVFRSSLTQQIARWHSKPRKTVVERLTAPALLGAQLSHQDILIWYVNEIYLGQGCFGVSGASIAYFGKPLREASLAEIAFLAALSRAPSLFNPVTNLERAVERRNFVLSEMEQIGAISGAQAAAARQTSLIVIEPLGRCTDNSPY
jgi:penicillin-binding protein 1A